GGDPLVQSDFVAALFRACKAEGFHTCCESTFHAPWAQVEKILPYTDLWISDIKQMDSALHRQYTGVGNELILENLQKLAA
ncbi:radical SAM protein, partial [Gemmiger formicilis]